MVIDLKELKKIRQQLDLTQLDLAKQSGVSQSLIAKVEAGTLDPSYSNAVRLMDTLSSLREKKSVKARDIMRTKIITIEKGTSIKEAIKKMHRYEISQIPIVFGKQPIGLLTEKSLLEGLGEARKPNNVEEIMEEAPPIINPNTTTAVVVHLLRHFSLVLVADKGNFKGVITKSDMLSALYP